MDFNELRKKLVSVKLEIDELFGYISRKQEILHQDNIIAEKFLEKVENIRVLHEKQKNMETISIKPHHSNYSSIEIKQTELLKPPLKSNNNNNNKFISSSKSISFNHENQYASYPSKSVVVSSRTNISRKKRDKILKVKKKKRLPLHVSKQEVQMKKDRKLKTNKNLKKLEDVLSLARKTREKLRESKESKKSINDKFKWNRAKKAKNKNSKQKAILKSDIPINKKKLQFEMEKMNEPLDPISQIPEFSEFSEFQKSGELKIKKMEESEVMKSKIPEIRDPQPIVRKKKMKFSRFGKHIELGKILGKRVRKKQDFLNSSISKFMLKNGCPVKFDKNCFKVQNIIYLSFLFGCFEYLFNLNEIISHSFSNNIQGVINSKNTNFDSINKEKMKDEEILIFQKFELFLKRNFFSVEKLVSPSNFLEEYEVEQYSKISKFLKKEGKGEGEDEKSNLDVVGIKRKDCWIPRSLYRNIEEIMFPKSLILNDEENCNILSYGNIKNFLKMNEGWNSIQDGLLHHYVEKIVSKNILVPFVRNDLFLENSKRVLLVWRFINFVISNEGTRECTFF